MKDLIKKILKEETEVKEMGISMRKVRASQPKNYLVKSLIDKEKSEESRSELKKMVKKCNNLYSEIDNELRNLKWEDINKIDEEIKSGIAVEVGCEKRTVEKIKKYDLEFVASSDVYTQKSNAYVLSYLWMRQKRKWYKIGFEPYNIESVYTKMPKTFDIDYTKLTDDVFDAFEHLHLLSNQE